MLIKTAQQEIAKLVPLFTGEHLALMIDSLAAGSNPGSLWVSDPRHPTAAFCWDHAHNYFFAGNMAEAGLLADLEKLLCTQIVPAALSRNLRYYKLYYADKRCMPTLSALFAHHAPVLRRRIFYSFTAPAPPTREYRLPPDFTLRPIDEALLSETTLRHHDDLIEEIQQCWGEVAQFAKHGFGTCLLHQDAIISRCTAEYLSRGKCGIGIETLPEYENRGFATCITTEFVRQCLQQQCTPHWDSWADNRPSVRVAEKVGFSIAEEYEVLSGFLRE